MLIVTQNCDIWVEKEADLHSGRLLEASCQKDEQQQREGQDLKSTFCTHWIPMYSNCTEICNYYNLSQPTKAMWNAFCQVHWKLHAKVQLCLPRRPVFHWRYRVSMYFLKLKKMIRYDQRQYQSSNPYSENVGLFLRSQTLVQPTSKIALVA